MTRKTPEPLVCPRCGTAMNRHAVRVMEPRSAEEVAQADRALGGIVTEGHTCPDCGENASRRP
jgi:ribosomal protein S27AE